MPLLPNTPAHFVQLEAEALTLLAVRIASAPLADSVEQALTLLAARSGHRILTTGIGKSGLIARKLAATLCSTGSPAHFLHPAEALHGDLGMLTPGDVVIALSYSGETSELLDLLPAFRRMNTPLITLTGCLTSTLARASAVALDVSVSAEACGLNLAPTASTTVMLALGDALALTLSHRSGFTPDRFAQLHPGGRLGLRLARVHDLMHAGDTLPAVTPATPMTEVIHEMSSKRLGMTTVLTPERQLAGIISDGDLRRLLERLGPAALQETAAAVMNPTPHTIDPAAPASEALARMEDHKITSLVVVDGGQVQGVLHLHDLWQPQPQRALTELQ